MTIQLNVQVRERTGNKVKQLRRDGLIPANVFGQNKDSRSIQVNAEEFAQVYAEAGQTSVIELATDGGKITQPVVVSDLQTNPITDQIIHIDFHRVDLNQAITAAVPVEFVGESLAVKDGALMVTLVTEFEVEALPNDMPHSIEVDISSLTEIGMQLTLEDLDTGSKYTILAEPDTALVKVEAPRAEETFDDEATAEGDMAAGESDDSQSADDTAETPTE